MSIESFLVDFDYLYNALKLHPSFYVDYEMSEFEMFYGKLRKSIVDYATFINAMTELPHFQ